MREGGGQEKKEEGRKVGMRAANASLT